MDKMIHMCHPELDSGPVSVSELAFKTNWVRKGWERCDPPKRNIDYEAEMAAEKPAAKPKPKPRSKPTSDKQKGDS